MTPRTDDASTLRLLVVPTQRAAPEAVPTAAATPAAGTRAPGPGALTWGLLWRTTLLTVVGALVGWIGTLVLLSGPGGHLDVPVVGPVRLGPAPRPAAEVAALADDMHLTAQGRALLYRSRPQLLGTEEFAGACPGGAASSAAGWVAAGCYRTVTRGPYVTSSIVVHRPADRRLHGMVVTMTAHELLHGAWETLTAEERADAAAVLERVVAGIDPADEIHTQIAGSVRLAADSRDTELFAYVGTQVWRPGGLDPRLEELYARTVTDREALVAVHTGYRETVAGLRAEVATAQTALAARRTAADAQRLQLDTAGEALARSRALLAQEEARFAAMTAQERAGWWLPWTWHDGTTLPAAPAEQTFAGVRALLVRDEADLAARAGALRAEQDAVVAEEERVRVLVADLDAVMGVPAPTVVLEPVGH